MAILAASDYHELPDKFVIQVTSSNTRGPKAVSSARAMAMYLVHVSTGLSMTRTGRAFGRDRTTVRHALRRIEDKRDDPVFDRALEGLAQRLRSIAAY